MIDFYITPEEYDIAKKNGIPRQTLEARIRDLVWDKKTAITKPPKTPKKSKWADVAERNGISRQNFYVRISRGMDEKTAATKPLIDRKKWADEMKKRRKFKYPSWVYKKCKENGIKNFHYRMKSGNYTLLEACTIKPLTAEECARKAHESRRAKYG